jgi:AcrR family transcriptional regulator
VNPRRAAEARDAAILLFAEKGYRGTTMNDIADLLGIRGPSLYKHVSSKQDVLQDIVISTMDMLLDHQRNAIESNELPADQLREMIRVGVHDHVENRPRAYVCTRELIHLEPPATERVQAQRDDYWHRARAVIEAGVARGDFHVASTSVATFCMTEFIASPAAWYSDNRRVNETELAEQMADMGLRLVGYGIR